MDTSACPPYSDPSQGTGAPLGGGAGPLLHTYTAFL